ncbi:MAG: hypothetical protein J6E41_04085 [Lachnospiraceae bacterium]|nr:hypothetical protein [Lachnospiraceae bacterium]
MNRILSLPGRGNTYFYFTQMGEEGFSQEQQEYIRSLILTYRKRFSALEITAVWDFGMEEGTRYENDKYGVFEKCRDLAVSNRDMASISYNHIRVSRMPMDISRQKLEDILKAYEAVRHISAMAGEIRLEMMASGMPPGRISEVINEKAAAYLKEEGLCLGSEEDPGTIAAGPHNLLALEDAYFADVWAVRQLEESMSIRRLTLHELGHAISDAYGVSRDKRIRRLLSKCRDGFEDREEFCAECFMASELTDRIPLADDVAAVYRACAGG